MRNMETKLLSKESHQNAIKGSENTKTNKVDTFEKSTDVI
jgi:hypothetical protein